MKALVFAARSRIAHRRAVGGIPFRTTQDDDA